MAKITNIEIKGLEVKFTMSDSDTLILTVEESVGYIYLKPETSTHYKYYRMICALNDIFYEHVFFKYYAVPTGKRELKVFNYCLNSCVDYIMFVVEDKIRIKGFGIDTIIIDEIEV